MNLLTETISKPIEDFTLSDRLRNLIPLLGTSEQFLRALHRFQLGKLRLDENEVREARVDGFVALVDTAIEAGLLLSIFSRGLLWSSSLARSLLLTGYSGRIARAASFGELDLIDPLARRLLKKSQGVRDLMDSVFELTRTVVISTAL